MPNHTINIDLRPICLDINTNISAQHSDGYIEFVPAYKFYLLCEYIKYLQHFYKPDNNPVPSIDFSTFPINSIFRSSIKD